MQQILKKQDESIDLYIKKIKELKDKLANAANVVEEDLVIYALNDLPSEYSAFCTSMQIRFQPISLSVHVLKFEEYAIENKKNVKISMFNQRECLQIKIPTQ